MVKETSPIHENTPGGKLGFIRPQAENDALHSHPLEMMKRGGEFHSAISDELAAHMDDVLLSPYWSDDGAGERISLFKVHRISAAEQVIISIESTHDESGATTERIQLQMIDDKGRPREGSTYVSRGAIVRRTDTEDAYADAIRNSLGGEDEELQNNLALAHYLKQDYQPVGEQELASMIDFVAEADVYRGDGE